MNCAKPVDSQGWTITTTVCFILIFSPQRDCMPSAITHSPYKLPDFTYFCNLDILQRQGHSVRTQAWRLSHSVKRVRCTTKQQTSVPIPPHSGGQCCSSSPTSLCWLFEECHNDQVCQVCMLVSRHSSFVGRKTQGGDPRSLCQL